MSGKVLSILAPSAFSVALVEAARAFEQKTGCAIDLSFGPASGEGRATITSKLARSERADLVILPAALLNEQIAVGKIKGDNHALMRSGIGVCVPAGAARPDISTGQELAEALVGARTVAYSAAGSGAYVSNVMFGKLGIAAEMERSGLTVTSEPVAAVVARGDATIGFQQMAELLAVEGISIAGPLPPDCQHYTILAGGLPSNCVNEIEAMVFIAFLRSRDAEDILIRAGLEPRSAW